MGKPETLGKSTRAEKKWRCHDVIQVSQEWCRTEAGILAFHQSSRRLIPYLRQ
jgi:hypothetical protein